MFTAYVAFTILTIALNGFSATCDFIGYKPVLIAMEKARVPQSWMFLLGVLKAAGVVGLLVGFAVPMIGEAAAIGLILYYIGAVITHLRVGDYKIGLAAGFLMLAVGSLAFRLISA